MGEKGPSCTLMDHNSKLSRLIRLGWKSTFRTFRISQRTTNLVDWCIHYGCVGAWLLLGAWTATLYGGKDFQTGQSSPTYCFRDGGWPRLQWHRVPWLRDPHARVGPTGWRRGEAGKLLCSAHLFPLTKPAYDWTVRDFTIVVRCHYYIHACVCVYVIPECNETSY